jgi:hypothetical protein
MRVRPGWLIVLLAAILAVSTWMPWLTTSAAGGGHANAVGGAHGGLDLPDRFGAGQLILLLASTLAVAGAMAARGLLARLASAAALIISLLLVTLTVWYHHINVRPPVAAGFGFYVGAVLTVSAVLCSLWALVVALASSRSARPS